MRGFKILCKGFKITHIMVILFSFYKINRSIKATGFLYALLFKEDGYHCFPLYWLGEHVSALSFYHDKLSELEKDGVEFLEQLHNLNIREL